jgi:hypothetical protein
LRKKKRPSRIPFVAAKWDMLNSKAFIELNASAGKALIYFLGKPKLFFTDPQYHLIEFSFSYAEGERLGFAPGTFSKIIQELVHSGFLDPVDKGGLRSDGKRSNLFSLSRRWEKYSAADFKPLEWRCFIPKPRATSKKEMNSSKKGNKGGVGLQAISHFESVGENPQ